MAVFYSLQRAAAQPGPVRGARRRQPRDVPDHQPLGLRRAERGLRREARRGRVRGTTPRWATGLFGGPRQSARQPAQPGQQLLQQLSVGAGQRHPPRGQSPRADRRSRQHVGLNLDVMNVQSKLSFGQTSAQIKANSTGDVYYLAGFVTSISTLAPDFLHLDQGGGRRERRPVAGDTLDYTIVVPNTGNDTSIHTVMTDVLPPGITSCPGSLQVTAGPNTRREDRRARRQSGRVQRGHAHGRRAPRRHRGRCRGRHAPARRVDDRDVQGNGGPASPEPSRTRRRSPRRGSSARR